MASDETIRKMVHAIMDKRRELGILDWGLVRPEEVIQRLNHPPKPKEEQTAAAVNDDLADIKPIGKHKSYP